MEQLRYTERAEFYGTDFTQKYVIALLFNFKLTKEDIIELSFHDLYKYTTWEQILKDKQKGVVRRAPLFIS